MIDNLFAKVTRTSNRLFGHSFRRTTLIIIACLGFITGVLYAPYGEASWVWLLPSLSVITILQTRRLASLVILFYLAVILGIIRGNLALGKEEALTQFMGQKVTLDAVVTDDGYYDSKKRVTFTADAFELLSPESKELDVPIRVNTFELSSATRGDVVRVSGKIYPTQGNVAGSIGFAEVETVGTVANFLDETRQKFTAGLRNGLPEPSASFAAGILIGQRSSLLPRWQDIIRDAGLTHIIAVSGYNLTILVRLTKRFLRRRSRYQIFILSSLLVTLFVGVTGLSPSILRACIVVALLQVTWFYGRKIHPLVLLGLAAAISLSIDPYQIWRSVGWYLSFAAFFGVIILAPLLVPKKHQKSTLRQLVAESFAAGIMTLPIISAIFGKVSLIGIVANLLVTPLVPLAMLLSLVAGVVGWMVPVLAGWFAFPARFLLTYMLDIANIVSSLPGARVSLELNNWQLGIFYAVVCVCIWRLYKKRKPEPFVLE